MALALLSDCPGYTAYDHFLCAWDYFSCSMYTQSYAVHGKKGAHAMHPRRIVVNVSERSLKRQFYNLNKTNPNKPICTYYAIYPTCICEIQIRCNSYCSAVFDYSSITFKYVPDLKKTNCECALVQISLFDWHILDLSYNKHITVDRCPETRKIEIRILLLYSVQIKRMTRHLSMA